MKDDKVVVVDEEYAEENDSVIVELAKRKPSKQMIPVYNTNEKNIAYESGVHGRKRVDTPMRFHRGPRCAARSFVDEKEGTNETEEEKEEEGEGEEEALMAKWKRKKQTLPVYDRKKNADDSTESSIQVLKVVTPMKKVQTPTGLQSNKKHKK
jgi:hypothetical protein